MIRPIAAAVWMAATVTLAGQTAPAAQEQMVIGTVEHVSVDNVKVKDDKSGKVLGFVLVPHFKKLFSKDGKTTEQMSALQPGTPVTVYYTQTLGVRHATRILINGSVKTLKS
jgi:hypothetical protein